MDPQMQYPQQGPPQGPPQPPPEPFTTADNMQLQRLQQAMSQARGQFEDGEINQQEFQQFQQQIQERMAPLQQRQQADMEQQKKQQEEEVTRQHAQQQALEQQGAEYRSKKFLDRVVTYIDPLSVPPRTAHFYEKSPNQWEEITFAGQQAEPEMEASDGP